MRLLLDTHTFLWAIAEPQRLSKTARVLLEDDENDLFLSAVSLWEITLKAHAGKLALPLTESYFREHLGQVGVARVLAVEPTHIYALLSLPAIHKDPFDRLLIAQAQVEKLAFVSADATLAQYPITVLW